MTRANPADQGYLLTGLAADLTSVHAIVGSGCVLLTAARELLVFPETRRFLMFTARTDIAVTSTDGGERTHRNPGLPCISEPREAPMSYVAESIRKGIIMRYVCKLGGFDIFEDDGLWSCGCQRGSGWYEPTCCHIRAAQTGGRLV